jgi:hypothetical protein
VTVFGWEVGLHAWLNHAPPLSFSARPPSF